jgi:hypothetical protein
MPDYQMSPVISRPDPYGQVFFVRTLQWPPREDEIAMYLFLDRAGGILWEGKPLACNRATWKAYVVDLLEAAESDRQVAEHERKAALAALETIRGASR